jgi:phosphomannomutase
VTAPVTPTGLTFGTAGLRAPVGPGPDQMNVPAVTRTSAGVAAWLTGRGIANPAVAVGYDSRYGSHSMARAAAETFAGAGCRVTLIARPAPTPTLARLVRDRGFDAGVQITASHNPKGDNGYKLYLAGGSQLVSPADREIENLIAAQPEAPLVHRSPDVHLDLGAYDGYVGAVASLVTSGDGHVLASRRALRVLYTPLHGVGGTALEQAFREAGFNEPTSVAAQRWPDPEFPTVEFPNPEEPGTCDLLLRQASHAAPGEHPDLLIALDPDADRCMVGVPDPAAPHGYRMLRGDETGPLLARRVVGTGTPASGAPAPVVATTVVSSSLLGRIAAAEGWDYRETLTGFKNLARAADDAPGELAYAYEEAIGTCPAPQVVADKDGIATALVTAAWAAELKAQGRTLRDELADLDDRYGVVRTAQVAVRFPSTAAASSLVAQWAAEPPTDLFNGAEATVTPLDESADAAEASLDEGFRLRWSGAGLSHRVVVRPSGTEPKAKFYLQVSAEAGDAAAETVETALADLADTVRRLTA